MVLEGFLHVSFTDVFAALFDEMGLIPKAGKPRPFIEANRRIPLVNFEMENFDMKLLLCVLAQVIDEKFSNPLPSHLLLDNDREEAGMRKLFVRLDVEIGHPARNPFVIHSQSSLYPGIPHPNSNRIFNLARIAHGEPR